MQKKYLIALAVIVLLIIIILIAPKQWFSKKPPVSESGNQTIVRPTATTTQAFIPVTTIPSTQVPKAMPSGLPFEKDAQILQNFEIKDPATGKTQSTRVYVSKKTLADSYSAYQKYLKENGWTITSSIDQPAVKNLSANLASAHMEITISKDSKGQVSVNVSYVK